MGYMAITDNMASSQTSDGLSCSKTQFGNRVPAQNIWVVRPQGTQGPLKITVGPRPSRSKGTQKRLVRGAQLFCAGQVQVR